MRRGRRRKRRGRRRKRRGKREQRGRAPRPPRPPPQPASGSRPAPATQAGGPAPGPALHPTPSCGLRARPVRRARRGAARAVHPGPCQHPRGTAAAGPARPARHAAGGVTHEGARCDAVGLRLASWQCHGCATFSAHRKARRLL